jgi:hypothetical protein
VEENFPTVTELHLVPQVAKGLQAVVSLLVGDEEEQVQEFHTEIMITPQKGVITPPGYEQHSV